MADEQIEWERREDVDMIIEYCVGRHHPHLRGANIVGVGRPKAAKKHGKVVWGSLKKPSPLDVAFFPGQMDYVLIVGLDVWTRLLKETRIALIDHELCHAGGLNVETGKWEMVGHDIEEFSQILDRHGCWRPDLEQAIMAAQRVVLPQITIDEMLKDAQKKTT